MSISREQGAQIVREVRLAFAGKWRPDLPEDRRHRGVCYKFTEAGSLRRGLPILKDVEIVCRPIMVPDLTDADLFGKSAKMVPAIDAKLERLFETGAAKRGEKWGDRYRQIVWNKPRGMVDLFMVHNDIQWGYIVLLRTGSHHYSKAFVTALPRRGFRGSGGFLIAPDEKQHPKWYGVCQNCSARDRRNKKRPRYKNGQCEHRGGRVACVEEMDCYTHTGLPYVPPTERSLGDGETLTDAKRRWGL